jgi:hypothetical protein
MSKNSQLAIQMPLALGNIVPGVFTPVLAKHSKHFSLHDALSIGVDRMQRNFDPMRQQVERWRAQQLSGEVARLTIYRAFIEGELEVPKHLARRVHDLYFNPQHEEFAPRTMWSLSNAFTSAFKELDPIPQFKATAKLGEFLEARFSQSFQALWRCRPDRRSVTPSSPAPWKPSLNTSPFISINRGPLDQPQRGRLALFRSCFSYFTRFASTVG